MLIEFTLPENFMPSPSPLHDNPPNKNLCKKSLQKQAMERKGKVEIGQTDLIFIIYCFLFDRLFIKLNFSSHLCFLCSVSNCIWNSCSCNTGVWWCACCFRRLLIFFKSHWIKNQRQTTLRRIPNHDNLKYRNTQRTLEKIFFKTKYFAFFQNMQFGK